MYVIPLILTEKVVKVLPQDFIDRIAECSTDIIKDKVMEYVNDPNADEFVKKRMLNAFGNRMAIQEYLESEETEKNAELISSLEYDSINLILSLAEMKTYRDAIKYILDSPYAVPYIPPINGSLIKSLREDVAAYAKDTGDSDIKQLAQALKNFSNRFRDQPHSSYKGTAVKKIIRNKGKYEIILRGLNFLIEKKEQNASPSEWRYL